MIDLTGRVALVTGSSRGIGRATALTLAAAGADVILNYCTSRIACCEVAEEVLCLGRQVWVVKADVAEEEDAAALMEFVKSRIGRLDILVSNAATGGFRPLLSSRASHFQHAMGTNVLALVWLVREALPLLSAGPHRGKVIALSSHGADVAVPWYGLVGGSKAALESVARHLTLEVGDHVNVNLVKPGLVDTDSTKKIPGVEAMFANRTAEAMVGERLLTEQDIANAIAFLASDLSDMIQGQTITVDGGTAVHV